MKSSLKTTFLFRELLSHRVPIYNYLGRTTGNPIKKILRKRGGYLQTTAMSATLNAGNMEVGTINNVTGNQTNIFNPSGAIYLSLGCFKLILTIIFDARYLDTTKPST